MLGEAAHPVMHLEIHGVVVGSVVKAVFERPLQVDEVADDECHSCEGQALGHEHPDDASASCPERAAHSDFLDPLTRLEPETAHRAEHQVDEEEEREHIVQHAASVHAVAVLGLEQQFIVGADGVEIEIPYAEI